MKKYLLGLVLALVAASTFAWRFPSTPEEYACRKEAGEKIGWFK
jgi:hypothetical protein